MSVNMPQPKLWKKFLKRDLLLVYLLGCFQLKSQIFDQEKGYWTRVICLYITNFLRVVCSLLWWTAVDTSSPWRRCKQICSGVEIPCWLKKVSYGRRFNTITARNISLYLWASKVHKNISLYLWASKALLGGTKVAKPMIKVASKDEWFPETWFSTGRCQTHWKSIQ